LDVLFIHPNFPGQFRQLVKKLDSEPGYRLFTLRDIEFAADATPLVNAIHFTYATPEPSGQETHPYVRNFEACVKRGQQTVKRLLEEKYQGFEPAVIYVHSGWGNSLFLKDIFPNAIIIGLFEYFYHSHGADIGFDPEFPVKLNDLFRIRTINAVPLQALEGTDIRLTPTRWQQSLYPPLYQDAIEVLHDGIDTSLVVPDPNAWLQLDNGLVLRQGDEVLTYVNRGLDPYRGFHVFMRTLPDILQARPDCQVLIVGGDKVHYGPSPAHGKTWREVYLEEMDGRLDLSRVHFLELVSFEVYLRVLQISRAHVYLTYPFVLSWSMLEAMAAECVVIASETAPVTEYIKHNKTGLLVPFFAQNLLASTVISVLSNPEPYRKIGKAARKHICKTLDFDQIIYPKHLAMLENIRETGRHS